MNFKDFYKNKKVFITGHTGFKGSWLLQWMHLLGAQVKGYALAPENDYDLFHKINGNKLCDSVYANILDKEKLEKEILSFEPDFIFHLAAQPLVRLSYKLPVETFEVNAIGTANILNALRKLDKPCVAVLITTDKVYHNFENGQFYKETDRLGGYDPYSASKACAELVIDSYRNSFFKPSDYVQHQKTISVARAGNVIGGGDWAKDRIIPDIVRALINKKQIIVRNPVSVRPWQHVMEPLHGYMILAAVQAQDPLNKADAYNFGPYVTDNLTVLDLAEKAISIWGEGEISKPGSSNNVLHEAKLLQLDIEKALTNLPWKPVFNANEAIAKTIEWYKQVEINKVDASSVTLLQINEFMKLI